MVTVDEGEVDFLVSSPVVYPTQCGYSVKNPEGEVVIDETSTSEAPPNTLNFVICESTASSVVEAPSTNPSISIFPNPVGTTAQLQGLSANEAWEVDILNLQGKVVRQLNGVGNSELDAKELPSGVYTVLLRSSGTVRTLRMIKT